MSSGIAPLTERPPRSTNRRLGRFHGWRAAIIAREDCAEEA